MKHVMHHAGLKNILEKLIVVNGPTRFDLKHPSLNRSVGVGIETLQYLAFASKKHRDHYLVFAGLSLLHTKSELLQTRAESGHNDIAVLIHSCMRIDALGKLFEELDDSKAECRGR
jgi:hypothetical protein